MRATDLKFVQIALAALLAGTVPAWAQTPATPPASPPAAEAAPPPQPPLVLLLDGLGVYVETPYIGVSALARPLQQQGFRTRVDSHMMAASRGLVPDIIIGHSMGGETALRYARQLARAGYPAPLVITVDAAPAPPACAVPRCVNIAGPGFMRVRGAVNISAWAAGARFVGHAQLPTHPAVQRIILQETAAWMATRQQALARAAAPKPAAQSAAKPAAKPAESPPQTASSRPAPATSWQQMWTVPGWTVPGWQQPGAVRRGG